MSCVRASADGADRAALRRARDGVRLFHVRDALVFERRDRTAGLSRSRLDSRTRTHRRAADDAAAAWRGAALRRARATLSGAGNYGRVERRIPAARAAADRPGIETKADRHRQRSAYWSVAGSGLAAAILSERFALGVALMPLGHAFLGGTEAVADAALERMRVALQ